MNGDGLKTSMVYGLGIMVCTMLTIRHGVVTFLYYYKKLFCREYVRKTQRRYFCFAMYFQINNMRYVFAIFTYIR